MTASEYKSGARVLTPTEEKILAELLLFRLKEGLPLMLTHSSPSMSNLDLIQVEKTSVAQINPEK